MTDTEAQPADPSASQPTQAPIAEPMSELPEDAIEAAAKAEFERDHDGIDFALLRWDDAAEALRQQYIDSARLALAAALPFLERATRAENEQLRAELRLAEDALRAIGKAWLVVKPTLDKPYPDAPETTPWLRFVEKPTRAAYNLGTKLRAARVARGGEATE